MTKTLTVRILGCGSSGGVPRLGGDWGACDPSEPRNRRSRCSILLTASSQKMQGKLARILIDTSPDMRDQLLSANADFIDAVLMTHEHADQCHGIDDLRAYAIRDRRRIPVYMDSTTGAILTQRFAYCFEGSGAYPAILDGRLSLVPGQTIEIAGRATTISVLPLLLDHGGSHSLGFRISDFAYCNDVVRIPEQTLAALKGVKTLVVDALRYSPHPTHANLETALRWIETIKPERAILTNMHVDLDYHTLQRDLPPHIEPAFDGMEFDVPLHN